MTDLPPPTPPPLPAGYAPLTLDQHKIDADHLRLLSIFHFAFAGIGFLGLAFLPMHYFLMTRVMTNPKFFPGGNAAPISDMLPFFKWMYVFFGAVIVVAMVLNALSGWGIARRKARGFSMVVAALDCLQIPFGTALGVFTLMVLTRDSVRAVYRAAGR